MLGKGFGRFHFGTISYFPQKTDLGISCKLPPFIWHNLQNDDSCGEPVFWEKKKKYAFVACWIISRLRKESGNGWRSEKQQNAF